MNNNTQSLARTRFGLIASVIGLVSVGVVLGLWFGERKSVPSAEYQLHTAVGREVARLLDLRGAPGAPHEVAQALRPAVVSIFAKAPSMESTGTGVVVRADGHILTNLHVVKGIEVITVQLSSGETYSASLVGIDEPTDLALIHIDCPEELSAVEWGDSEALIIGEEVVAMGNAFGLGWSVTHGIVSSLHRSARGYQRGGYSDFIQTDAAINPGNSGGPLVDMSGRVIGINSLLVSGAGNGIGFALPARDAQFVAEELLGDARVDRGFLGIDGRDLQRITREQRERLGVHTALGVHVDGLSAGGVAELAGLKVGDAITSMDGHRIEGIAMLKARVARTAAGTRVTLGLLRGGEQRSLELVLAPRPEQSH
ncbi:MAG: trypsin-like serine protease [Planctomycetes bacterium]|nr:trypsin-like serine protease [Planctomycetota bacterium]